ncbi:MAG: cell envelope integrity protein CreD, partial [Bacteroidota bacterium]|nr:cell envelope integrity protein CreD [Bacteroidota bacterium]
FTATWRVLHLNRNYPQAWRSSAFALHESDMGVNLMVPVDQYQKSIRTAKYSTMLISLTFLIFFFVEVLNRRRIHPVQYILVGLALCVFYTLLVALSEHMAFNLAYALAAIGVIGLITAYSTAMFKQRRLTLLLTGILVLLFGFVFTIIQLEDLALLMGSIGLFIVLAIVMYLSRKVDWYSIQSTSGAEEQR